MSYVSDFKVTTKPLAKFLVFFGHLNDFMAAMLFLKKKIKNLIQPAYFMIL